MRKAGGPKGTARFFFIQLKHLITKKMQTQIILRNITAKSKDRPIGAGLFSYFNFNINLSSHAYDYQT